MTDEAIEERYYCENYRCRDCKHFRFVNRNEPNSGCQRRIDWYNITYGGPWFCCTPEELPFPCNEFEPSNIHVYGKSVWKGYDDWLNKWIIYWNNGKPLRDKMRFHVKGEKIDYYAKTSDWINGTMYDNEGNPKWIELSYLKKTREGYGYKRVFAKYEEGQWIQFEK